MSEPALRIKGTAVQARMAYIEQRWGTAGLAEAKARLAKAHGLNSVLASGWYPRDTLVTLEALAQALGRDGTPHSRWEMGEAEARHFLTGPYGHLAKKNPNDLAVTLPLLFSCLYLDVKLVYKTYEPGKGIFTLEGEGFNLRDGEVVQGFLRGAFALSGVTRVEVRLAGNATGRAFAVSWGTPAVPVGEASVEVIPVAGELGIIEARGQVRKVGERMGFGAVDIVGIATCVSELARNIVNYAGSGTITLAQTRANGGSGLRILAEDRGPGIPNLDAILSGQYRSEKGMGMGLRAIKRLADEFSVQSSPGQGTRVEIIKYMKRK